MGVGVLQVLIVINDIKARNGARKPELARLRPFRIFSRRSWQPVSIVPIIRVFGDPTSDKFKHLLWGLGRNRTGDAVAVRMVCSLKEGRSKYAQAGCN